MAAESGLADVDAVRSTIATAAVQKDTPSLQCGRSRSSERLLWQRGGFSTVVHEDGGILRWRDQGL